MIGLPAVYQPSRYHAGRPHIARKARVTGYQAIPPRGRCYRPTNAHCPRTARVRPLRPRPALPPADAAPATGFAPMGIRGIPRSEPKAGRK